MDTPLSKFFLPICKIFYSNFPAIPSAKWIFAPSAFAEKNGS